MFGNFFPTLVMSQLISQILFSARKKHNKMISLTERSYTSRGGRAHLGASHIRQCACACRLHEKPFRKFVWGTACEVTFGGDAAVPGFYHRAECVKSLRRGTGPCRVSLGNLQTKVGTHRPAHASELRNTLKESFCGTILNMFILFPTPCSLGLPC